MLRGSRRVRDSVPVDVGPIPGKASSQGHKAKHAIYGSHVGFQFLHHLPSSHEKSHFHQPRVGTSFPWTNA